MPVRPAGRRSQDGASTVEYALLISFIAAVIVASVVLFGTQVSSLFTETCDEVRGAAAASRC